MTHTFRRVVAIILLLASLGAVAAPVCAATCAGAARTATDEVQASSAPAADQNGTCALDGLCAFAGLIWIPGSIISVWSFQASTAEFLRAIRPYSAPIDLLLRPPAIG